MTETNFTNEQLEAWAGLGPWHRETGCDDDGEVDLESQLYVCDQDTVCDITVVCTLPECHITDSDKREERVCLIASAPALAAALLAERKAREVEVEVGEAEAEITRLRQSLADIANGTNSWFNQAEEALLNARSRIRNEARQALKGQRDD